MAKGLRASTRKRNNRKLVEKVFGPVEDARAERLSAKLQELAAQPRPERQKKMEIDVEPEVEAEAAQDGAEGTIFCIPHHDLVLIDWLDMDVDAQGAKMKPVRSAASKKKNPGRIEKKVAKSKAKKSIVFSQDVSRRKREVAQRNKR